MKYFLTIKDDAITDARIAYTYYESQQRGLGEKFLKTLENIYAVVLKNPYVYQVRFQSTRFAMLKKFPFVVIYEVSKTEIVIYFIVHSSRDENRWKVKLK